MEPRQYRTSVATSVFLGVGGAAFLALIVMSFIDGVVNSNLGAGEIIIYVFALPLSLFFISSALRPAAMDADETGLRVRKLFGSERIPWNVIQDFSVEPGGRSGPSLHANLRSGKIISLPSVTSSGNVAWRIAGELEEFRTHAESQGE